MKKKELNQKAGSSRTKPLHASNQEALDSFESRFCKKLRIFSEKYGLSEFEIKSKLDLDEDVLSVDDNAEMRSLIRMIGMARYLISRGNK